MYNSLTLQQGSWYNKIPVYTKLRKNNRFVQKKLYLNAYY